MLCELLTEEEGWAMGPSLCRDGVWI